jgi:hypothetical protein
MNLKNKTMENIKVFTSKFLQHLGQCLQSEEAVLRYMEGKSPIFSATDVKDTVLKIETLPKLDADVSAFENAKVLYKSLGGIDRTLASDQRLWAWLAHVPFMEYMSKRWPVADQPKEKRVQYIAQHWFVETQTGRSYLRNSIALLWWGAYMTYDEKRNDPFELTRIFFEYYQDTTVFSDSLGRSDLFIHSLLDFVINNPEYFMENKRDKIRELVRRLNFIGAYRVLPALDEKSLRDILKESMH